MPGITAILRARSRRPANTSMIESLQAEASGALVAPVENCEYPSLSTEFPKGFPSCASWTSICPFRPLSPVRRPTSILVRSFMPKKSHNPGQIVLFPGAPGEANKPQDATGTDIMVGAVAPAIDIRHTSSVVEPTPCQVVLSGSYR